MLIGCQYENVRGAAGLDFTLYIFSRRKGMRSPSAPVYKFFLALYLLYLLIIQQVLLLVGLKKAHQHTEFADNV